LEPTSKEKIPVVEGQPPKDPLVACLTFRRGDRAAGVAGLPVRFGLLNAEGVLQAGVPVRTRGMQGTRSAVSSDASATVQSDADGLVTCQVLALKGGNEKVQTVSAGMDVDALFQELGEVDQDQVRRWLSPLRELKAVFVLESAEDVKLSLADWTDRRVRRLTEQTGWPKDAKVLIGAFTYRDTKAAGEFGRALTRLFATALGKAGVGVVRNDPQRTAPILRGEYWDDEKLIDIRVQLEDQSGRQLVATAACLSRPEAGSYALTPEKEQLAKFQETAESLSDPKIRVQKDFSIQIWTDRGTAPFYEEGEKMTVFLRPTKECFVRLLYITADRKTLLIYPNDWGTSDRLEAGKVYQIPGKQDRFDFEISGPFGPEILKVIAATERMPVPKGEKISGAILLADAAPENLACLFRGITVKKRVEESSEAPAARWDAEAEVVVNTGPR
jgi:hypothetical protein